MKLKIDWDSDFLLKIRKFIIKYFFNKKYVRYGKCIGCGECCTHIYVRHKSEVINDEEKFKKLQRFDTFYQALKVIGKDEIGLIFECTNLDNETKRCKIHYKRGMICRKYPQEEIFILGGALGEKCGFRFEPIDKFSDIFANIQKKSK